MDYVKPVDIAKNMLAAGTFKVNLPIRHLLLRGALAGAFLAVATSMSVTAAVETGYWLVGSLLFPFGLCLVVLLGTELITGSFALLPVAAVENKEGATVNRVLANWGWVFLGNLLGSALYAALLAISLTMDGAAQQVSPVAAKLIKMAEIKTTGYAAFGFAGMVTVITKAILCNWLVSLGVIMAFSTTSLIGKMLAMWGPVVLFFSQGFEHSVVNMFVIPVGMMMGAHVTIADWWIWNQIPVTIGNLVGGMLLTGLALYLTHRPPKPVIETAPASAELLPEIESGQISPAS
jgi:formate transporter